MARNEFNFTKAKIDALALPEKGKRLEYFDSRTPGLQIRITSTGSITFCFYRWVKETARPERVTLGKYPLMTIEQARKGAMRLNAEVSDGSSPVDRIRTLKNEMTFYELFEHYMERHSKPNKITWSEDLDKYNLYLTSLGKMKLSLITKADISLIHSKLTKEGKGATANRALALVSSVFGRAIEWGIWDKMNPASGIRRNKEKTRDRFIQPDELPRFFKALSDEPNTTIRDYILISLLTGARRTNAMEMCWQDINFERREWRIPRTKNGTPQTITLSPEAIEVLSNRQDESDSVFVFPSRSQKGHLTEPKLGWDRICKRAGLEDLRIHDLRRTLGSWQARTGASLVVIGKSLNHLTPSTTAIYARLDSDPVRESVDKATAAMMKAGNITKSADVVELKKRKKQSG